MDTREQNVNTKTQIQALKCLAVNGLSFQDKEDGIKTKFPAYSFNLTRMPSRAGNIDRWVRHICFFEPSSPYYTAVTRTAGFAIL